jgi:hypothetical protein
LFLLHTSQYIEILEQSNLGVSRWRFVGNVRAGEVYLYAEGVGGWDMMLGGGNEAVAAMSVGEPVMEIMKGFVCVCGCIEAAAALVVMLVMKDK